MTKKTALESAKLNPHADLPPVSISRIPDEMRTPFDGTMIVPAARVRANRKKATDSGVAAGAFERGSAGSGYTPRSRIDLSAITHVTQAGEEWEEAEAAKRALRQASMTRSPVYFEIADLEPVLRYKLREQRVRTEHLRAIWTDEMVRTITRAAFAIVCNDKDLELRMRTAVLTTLPGVAVPVASAILAIADPDHYGIIDFRNWRQLFRGKRSALSISDYSRYMSEVRKFATELGWSAQRVDWCIWQHDRLTPHSQQ